MLMNTVIPRNTSMLCASIVLTLLLITSSATAADVTIYPAPSGEQLSSLYTLKVNGRSVPVYRVRVAPAEASRRTAAMDYAQNATGELFDEAAFAYFDMQGTVEISVGYKDPITSAKLLPDMPGTRLITEGNTVRFSLTEPRNLTLQVNEGMIRTLHIFANPPETDVPSPKDPNVVYFGPGIHEVSSLVVGDGKTLYIAGGAIVRIAIAAAEPFTMNARRQMKMYQPAIRLVGSNIKVRGRGIVDGSMIPNGKGLMEITGKNISVEGIILRDSSNWNMPVRGSDTVSISNVKILGYRLNSDGIDVVSSRNVNVQDCFIRTFDDLIVVKALAAGGPSTAIVARRNVLWNEKAHALSIGAEVQADINNVTFADNDVIHDLGHLFALGVMLSDSGNVSNIHFENIRINQNCIAGIPQKQCPGLISLWIGKSGWSRGAELGHIRNVAFTNIQGTTSSPRDRIELAGASTSSNIEGVLLDDVVINGRPVSKADIKENSLVTNVTIKR